MRLLILFLVLSVSAARGITLLSAEGLATLGSASGCSCQCCDLTDPVFARITNEWNWDYNHGTNNYVQDIYAGSGTDAVSLAWYAPSNNPPVRWLFANQPCLLQTQMTLWRSMFPSKLTVFHPLLGLSPNVDALNAFTNGWAHLLWQGTMGAFTNHGIAGVFQPNDTGAGGVYSDFDSKGTYGDSDTNVTHFAGLVYIQNVRPIGSTNNVSEQEQFFGATGVGTKFPSWYIHQNQTNAFGQNFVYANPNNNNLNITVTNYWPAGSTFSFSGKAVGLARIDNSTTWFGETGNYRINTDTDTSTGASALFVGIQNQWTPTVGGAVWGQDMNQAAIEAVAAQLLSYEQSVGR